MQTLIVAVLVLACSVYALWKLLPAAARRGCAGALLRLPRLPARVAARLRRAAEAAPGCGCAGCDAGAPARAKPSATERPIVFRPRPKR